MSRNPHPDAGILSRINEIGAMFVCVPCLAQSRHDWAVRAVRAELRVEDLDNHYGNATY
jgi:hypothetical protein